MCRMRCSTYGTARESLEEVWVIVEANVDICGEKAERESMGGRDIPPTAAVLVEGISETASASGDNRGKQHGRAEKIVA